jgi:hypothetical protein
VEVDVGLTQDDVDTKVGVKPKLRVALVVIATVPVCRRMSRRTRLPAYDLPVGVKPHDKTLAATERDDDYQRD